MSGVAKDKDTGILTDPVSEMHCAKCQCEIDVAGLESFIQVECPDCGALQTVPARLGPFLLVEMLGAGGMGGVYLARDVALGREVAVKVMLRELGQNQEFVENFRREARAAAQLNHPNTVQIYSFGQEKGQPYIVMELVRGRHLDEMIDSTERLPEGFVMRVGAEIATGLQAADEIGLLHGDIKPENILLDDKDVAKLVDFGLASFANQGQSEGIWGTPYYIAPEKLKRKPADARSDMYSLGATLFHTLTGRPPFEGATPIEVVKARLNAPPPDIRPLRPDLHASTVEIITRMLQEDPAQRHPTYKSLISDLRKASEEAGGGHVARDRKKVIIKAVKGKTLKKATTAHADGGAAPTGDTGAKAATGAAAEPAKAAEPPAPPGSAPRKSVKIKKTVKKGLLLSGGTLSGGTLSGGSGTGQAGESAAAGSAAPVVPKKKRSTKGVWITLAVLCSLAVVGGVVALSVRNARKAERARNEARLLERARNDGFEVYRAVGKQVTNILEGAALLPPLQTQAQTFYKLVFDDALAVPDPVEFEILTPDPVAPPPAVDGFAEPGVGVTDTTADATNTAAVAADATATNAAALPAAPADPAAGATNAPAAAPPTEPAPAASTNAAPAVPAPAAAAATNAAAAPPAAPVPVEPAAPAEDPNLTLTRKLGKEIMTAVSALIGIGDAARAVQATATEHYTNVEKAKASPAARAHVRKLEKIATDLAAAQTRLGEETEAIRKKIEQMDRASASVRKQREEEARLKREEEERLKREEEERRKAEEQRVKLEADRAKIAQWREGYTLRTRQNLFADVATEAKAALSELQTPEGKEEWTLRVERYELLAEMKSFLIERITASPYQFGYGTGASARSILAANKDGLKLKGDELVPWTSVSPWQLGRLVDNYTDGAEARKISATVAARIVLAFAIYCDEMGEKGAAKRDQYADRARQRSGVVGRIADRLFAQP